jgi:hypothetical protein
MQTCIVHSRAPVRFVSELRAARAGVAALLVFGAVASALVWPAFAFSTFWRAFGPGPAEVSRFREGADLLVYLVACAGVFGILIPAFVAARRRRIDVGVVGLASLPLYYLLVSISAWTAVVDLVVRPHFWAKTEHGRQRRGAARDARAGAT